jgi:NADH dehydrogenase
MMPGGLPEYTAAELGRLGVTVHLNCPVREIGPGRVEAGALTLTPSLIVWAAGVEANSLTRSLGAEVPLDRGGRIEVRPDLSVPGHPNVFAAGDLVSLVDKNGVKVPGVAPAASQMGRFIAKLIEHDDRFRTATRQFATEVPRPAFTYWDKGTMATIGRSKAVAVAGPMRFTGLLAWLMWLFIHLLFLVGMRNRASVFLQWVWAYVTWERGARIITR